MDDIEIVEIRMPVETLPLEVITEESKNIDYNQIAKEVLGWLISNVENYIDNHKKVFKNDLVVDGKNAESMAETLRLQNLYRAIPDDSDFVDLLSENVVKALEAGSMNFESKELDDISECRAGLDDVTEKAYEAMKGSKDLLTQLYAKMIYYYELSHVNKGSLVIKELIGELGVIKFQYDAFDVGVEVMSADDQIQEKTLVKRYTIHEGFTVWIEIAFNTASRPSISI